jgi:DNA-binding MarR family transcriptional regulator
VQSTDSTRATEALLAASRALIGIAARALPETADVTLPQWRALILLDSEGQLNVSTLSGYLAIEPSSCTRLCDRLERKGLIERRLSEGSRREMSLGLSPAGSALVAEANARRRAEIEELVGRLTPAQRRDLAAALGPLVDVAGQAADRAWVLGWAD